MTSWPKPSRHLQIHWLWQLASITIRTGGLEPKCASKRCPYVLYRATVEDLALATELAVDRLAMLVYQ